MTVVINGSTGISPVSAAGTSALVDGMTVGRGAGEVATNTAVGASALAANTTGDANTAVGYNAGATNLIGTNNTFIGRLSGTASTTDGNTSVGAVSLYRQTTGQFNTAVGYEGLRETTSGANNAAFGYQALRNNTTASNNTAVGYQAGYTYNGTSGYNTLIGYQAGLALTGTNNAGYANVLVGPQAGYAMNSTTASQNIYNTFVGPFAGNAVTTGSKNTILGGYNGNQGGLDIRTANNYIVLSDGDGNPAAYYDTQYWNIGLGGTGSAGTGLRINGSSASGYQPIIVGKGNGTTYWYAGTKGWIDNSTSTGFEVQVGGTGGVYVASGGTSWTAASDERLKDIIEPITDAANKVSTLRAVIGKYKSDGEGVRRAFLIAQDVQAVLPEAVDSSTQIKGDDTEYLGVAYTEVIPLLVAAIKELKAEFDAYKEAHP